MSAQTSHDKALAAARRKLGRAPCASLLQPSAWKLCARAMLHSGGGERTAESKTMKCAQPEASPPSDNPAHDACCPVENA